MADARPYNESSFLVTVEMDHRIVCLRALVTMIRGIYAWETMAIDDLIIRYFGCGIGLDAMAG